MSMILFFFYTSARCCEWRLLVIYKRTFRYHLVDVIISLIHFVSFILITFLIQFILGRLGLYITSPSPVWRHIPSLSTVSLKLTCSTNHLAFSFRRFSLQHKLLFPFRACWIRTRTEVGF